MKTKFTKLWQIRGVKQAIELILIFAIYFAVQGWLQRDMAAGMPPPIRGTLLNGQQFDLQTLRGKPVLLHFWASWCSICRLEQDNIESISKKYTVISIAGNSGNDDEVKQYMQAHRLNFPVLNDPDGYIGRLFGIRGFPTSFILHPDGRIAYSQTGYTTGWGLRIRLWLAGS